MNHLDAYIKYEPYLKGIAYRMTGSVTDTEDILQETYIKWAKITLEQVDSFKAFLISITVRLCLDLAKSARKKREVYPGEWLPEPVLTGYLDVPGQAMENDESLSVAFLLLLERLNPVERAVFILREVFDYDYEQISLWTDKSPENCRQLFSRSRKSLASDRTRYRVNPDEQRKLLLSFLDAARRGDMEGLLAQLTEGVQVSTDGGGKVSSAINIIYGARNTVKFILGLRKKRAGDEFLPYLTTINGRPGIIQYRNGKIYNTMTLESDQYGITRIYSVMNPDKLQHLPQEKSGWLLKLRFVLGGFFGK